MMLVTGGAGFIGSHLATALIKRGHQVRVADNLSTGRRENLGHLMGKIDWLEGTLTDPAFAERALDGVNIVFHEAAVPSVPRSVADPLMSHHNNLTVTLNLLEAARKQGVKRFVYAASSSAYGDTETLPKIETMPARPLSPYAISKLAGEWYCQVYHRIFGVPTVCLRYFNVFGERQDPRSTYAAVIPRFAVDLLNGQAPTIFGDGEQSRDFTYIANVVEANLLAADAPHAAGEVINIACGRRISLNQLVGILQRLTNCNREAAYAPARQGDVKHSLASIEKAKRLLGYSPAVTLEEGLTQTVEALKLEQGYSRAA